MSKLYVFPVITASLGIWQIYRLQWKKDIIDRMTNQPLEIKPFQPKETEAAEGYGIHEFEMYELEGQFGESVLVGPRPRANHLSPSNNSERNIGYTLISAFKTKFGNILINRGWLPDSKKHLVTTDTSERVIVGQARTSEPKSMFVNNNEGFKTIDIELLSKHLNALPLCFEISQEHVKRHNELEKNLWTRNLKREIKNDHLEYALTWFGLTFFMTVLIRTRKNRKVF